MFFMLIFVGSKPIPVSRYQDPETWMDT